MFSHLALSHSKAISALCSPSGWILNAKYPLFVKKNDIARREFRLLSLLVKTGFVLTLNFRHHGPRTAGVLIVMTLDLAEMRRSALLLTEERLTGE